MQHRHVLGLGISLFPAHLMATPAQVPFDRVYTVSSVGSTTPVTKFPIDGPAPVIYLDLPARWGQYSYGSSNWFAGAGTTSLFSPSSTGIFTSAGEYWLTPDAATWASRKSLGDWHINASYGWWDLVIIYGGGAPVTKAQGSATVNFSVNSCSPGDANLDGAVNSLDFSALAGSFGMQDRSWQNGDFNFDNVVNALDFNTLASHFGQSQPATSVVLVPEPALASLALAVVSIRARVNRKSPKGGSRQ